MFDNIGAKIKNLVVFLTWFGIIVSLIIGIYLISYNESLTRIGVLIMILGPLFSWVSSFLLYGFGELVENSKIIADTLKEQSKISADITTSHPEIKPKETLSRSNSLHNFKCDKCGKTITSKPCPYCEEENFKKAPKQERSNIPIKVYRTSDDHIICPVCKTTQNGNRYKCFHCEQKFVNGQPDIPYWCRNCGKKGPYDGNCPDCNSTIKILNN